MPVFSNGSESTCNSPWSFRSCLVSKDNFSSEINNDSSRVHDNSVRYELQCKRNER